MQPIVFHFVVIGMEELKIEQRTTHCLIQPQYSTLSTPQAAALKAALQTIFAEGNKNLLLDLGNISVLDSSGLAVILIANKTCHLQGGKLVIANAGQHIIDVIHISQLQRILNLSPSIEQGEHQFMTAA